MVDYIKELEAILKDDPLGLLDVKPKRTISVTPDERLIASFEEINLFVENNKREPRECEDIHERKLYSRLKGIRRDVEKVVMLTDYDTHNLLASVNIPKQQEIETIEDIFENDSLGLLNEGASADLEDIFDLKHIPKSISMPDHIAHRKPCEEFDKFEPLFKRVHTDLVSKKKTTIPFKSENQIRTGEYFLLQGMVVYVANMGKWEKRNFGNRNARLYCVFENGTESYMLLRSLAAALWKDQNSRQIIDADQKEMYDQMVSVDTDDKSTGYIYVVKSLSDTPEIKEINNLYKIGFSKQPTKERIADAEQDPTYLMSKVEVVAEFETYNLNPQKFELLLHRFFAKACLNLDVYDSNGNRHTPREWFIVPLHIITTAIQLLVDGDIIHYRYDADKQAIIEK